MNENDLTQYPTEPNADSNATPTPPEDFAPPPDDAPAALPSADALLTIINRADAPMAEDPDVDVDAALAAVASLSIMSDRHADALTPGEPAPPPEQLGRRARRTAFPAPSLITPRRGSLTAIVTGLLFIAGGGWWTYLNLTDNPPERLALLAAAVAGAVIAMLVAWLAGGRWARGLLFTALIFGGLPAALALFILAPELDIALTYPLLLTVPGAACLFTALLGRPATPRLLLPAAALIVAAVVGAAYTAGLIPPLDLAGLLPPA